MSLSCNKQTSLDKELKTLVAMKDYQKTACVTNNDEGTIASDKPNNENIIDNEKEEKKKLKKQLKKQKQREKKRIEKLSTTDVNKHVNENDAHTDNSIASSLDKDLDDSKSIASYVDEKLEDSVQDDTCTDEEEIDENGMLYFLESTPAFIAKALQKGNTRNQVNAKSDKQNAKFTSTDNNGQSDTVGDSYNKENYNDNNFTFVKSKRTRHVPSSYKSSKLCVVAVKLIMENKIPSAIEHLSKAIEQYPSCLYNYVNRSFCYLRSKQYRLAIADAQYVIQNSSDQQVILKAKYILAHAYCRIEDYSDAEKNIKDCLSLVPQDIYFNRELMQIRMIQLCKLGFRERDVMCELKAGKSTLDVIDALIKKVGGDNEGNNYEEETDVFDEDEVYYSDNSEHDNAT